MEILPNQEASTSKKVQVEEMFDDIAGRYDFLNKLLSFRIDRIWRKKVRKALEPYPHDIVLDMATGTADLAIELSKLNPKRIEGVDLSQEMLNTGQIKIEEKKLDHIIKLQKGDSEKIDFKDEHFDAASVAFGVRNFENLDKGLSELYRVLKPKGILVILEFSQVKKFPMKQLYHLYFRYICPIIGKIFSGNMKAYNYLHNSASVFPEGDEMCLILKNIGFSSVVCKSLTFGVSSIYLCEK